MKTFFAVFGAGVLLLVLLGAVGIGNFDGYYGTKTLSERCTALHKGQTNEQ